MSIIRSNRLPSRIPHAYIDASMATAMKEPSKRDLREMLAEAAANTARLARDDGKEGDAA